MTAEGARRPRRHRRLGWPESLRARLILATAATALLILAGFGVLLHQLLDRFVTESYEARLEATTIGLLAAIDFDDSEAQLLRDVGEPQFDRVRSGWYWQVSDSVDVLLSSRSLWTDALLVPPDAVTGSTIPGPAGEPLHLFVHRGNAPGIPEPVTIVATAPSAEIDAQLAVFLLPLIATLAALGAALLAMVVWQVRFALQPIHRTRRALERVRTGRATRVEGPIPRELEPLVFEINGLIDHSHQTIERSRHHLGDLAHALKTPLAVIRNRCETLPADESGSIEEASEQMERLLRHHLRRARAAGAHHVLGQVTPVAPVLESFAALVAQLRRTHPVRFQAPMDNPAQFAGDRMDLEEMLGNLVENATKWARTQITIDVDSAGDRLRLAVQDDGPGMDPDDLAIAVERGVRLDESAPGTGLGLAIVRDLAALYGGTLTLGNGPVRGLVATLELPAA